MPSPFPGMNPYLERATAWHDFHESFCVACRNDLVAQVRPRYIVRLDEHVYIHEFSSEERGYVGRPDVHVSAVSVGPTKSSASSVTAPVEGRIVPAVDFERECYLEILDRESLRVVTVIELLSPANKKPGGDREQFLAKRQQLLGSDAHYVEIDLLRGGPRLPIEGLPPCDYYALVSRVEGRPAVGLWPVALRDPLPRIPVPLRAPHSDAWLDLQALLHETYDSGGYEDFIYSGPPEPKLASADLDWAVQASGRG